jgi:hypothetical protein
MSAFDRALEWAWSAHGDNPRAATAKLESALPQAATEGELEDAARFLFHVYGVHFGDWETGAARLRALRGLPAWSQAGQAERAIGRSLRALELAATEDDGSVDLSKLTASEQVQAYAQAAQCLMERGADARAMAYLQTAVARCDEMQAEHHDPCHRALAIAGNNIATGYEDWPMLDETQRNQMIVAAHIGRRYWERAGTWLEVERAEYRLAKCMLIADYAALAVRHAQACLRLCEDHNAPPLEYFFGVEVLAMGLSAMGDHSHTMRLQEKARQLFAELSKDDQAFCASTLKSIEGLRTAWVVGLPNGSDAW